MNDGGRLLERYSTVFNSLYTVRIHGAGLVAVHTLMAVASAWFG